jgi:large subunit ribosomal protein L35
MPKAKTSSSVKKRFKVTAGGKLLRRRAMKSHNLEKKSSKRKRGFRKDTAVDESNVRALKKMIGGKRGLR